MGSEVDTPDSEAVEAALNAAVRKVITDSGIGLPVKWVTLAEVYDAEDDQRSLWTFMSPDLLTWDALGLITYAQHTEAAKINAEYGDE